MKWRLLEDDPITGTKEWFVPSSDGETFGIATEQNITPLLEQAYENRKAMDKHQRWGDGQLVARIPNSVLFDPKNRHLLRDDTALKKWLNDPDNAVFRLRYGKV
jgi:hypothetical protein